MEPERVMRGMFLRIEGSGNIPEHPLGRRID